MSMAVGTPNSGATAIIFEQWEDLNFDPLRGGGPAATLPGDVTIDDCLYREFDSGNNELCGATQEVPHAAQLSKTFYPHVHVFLKASEAAGTTGVEFTFTWQLRVNGAETHGSVVLSATSAQLTAAEGLILKISDSTGFAGPSVLASQLAVTLARTGGDAGDVVVTTFGVHYKKDSMGSDQIGVK